MLKANNEIFNELLYKLNSTFVDYEMENQSLNEEIKRLKMENDEQQTKIKKANSLDPLLKSLFSYVLTNVPFTSFHMFLAENSEDNTINRVELAHKLIKLEEYDFVLNWCKYIISLQFSEVADVKRWSPIIIEVLNKIMDREYEEIGERNEKYLSVLQFIHDVLYSEYHDVMFEYLEKFFDFFHDLIIDNNEPAVILKYIDCILDYNHKEIFSKLMNNLVDDWPFLDSNVSESEFTRFLFYAFLNELDTKLVDKAKIANKFLLTNSPEINLYTTFYSTINEEIPYPIGKIKIEELKSKQTIFDENHFKWILEKIYQRLTKFESKPLDKVRKNEVLKQQDVYRIKQVYYIPNIIAKKHSDLLNHLNKESVVLELYKNKFDFLVRKEIVVNTLFSKNTGKHYVTERMVKEINKKTGNLWFDVRESSSERVFQENHSTLFNWPLTDTSVAKSSLGETELRNNSDLKKLGYQITGLTRQKRWEILTTKAIPVLGLKKIVYTISFLVRGRKSMKNGLIRNKNSITEWEHDLSKLKQNYYKKDFQWPQT
jgi:hypothetical protein